MSLPDPGSTARTRVRRIPDNAITDRFVLHAILDGARLAHVGIDVDGQPFVVPVACARRGEELLIHGSTGSRLFRALDAGAPACVTVTLVDGLVLARSAFESSMNYRSVMVLGTARRLSGDDELDALRVLTEHLLPGRWAEVRHPSAKERAATMTLAFELVECSVKVRTGGPDDDPADLVDPALANVWTGDVPLREVMGEPLPDASSTDLPVPAYVREWGPA